jgi:hypothetical protein
MMAGPDGFPISPGPVPELMAACAAVVAAAESGRRSPHRLPYKEEQQEDNQDVFPWFAHGQISTFRYHNVSIAIIVPWEQIM